MSILSVAVAKEKVRFVYDAEVETIQISLDAAERHAANYLGRALFGSEPERLAARTAAPATLAAAVAANDVAVTAAQSQANADIRNAMLDALAQERAAAFAAFRQTMAGIVITPNVKEAVLMIFGHLFSNRSAVIAGDAAQAIEVPLGAQSLLFPDRVGLGV